MGLQKRIKLFQEINTLKKVSLVVAGHALIMATVWDVLFTQKLCNSHQPAEVLMSLFDFFLICRV